MNNAVLLDFLRLELTGHVFRGDDSSAGIPQFVLDGCSSTATSSRELRLHASLVRSPERDSYECFPRGACGRIGELSLNNQCQASVFPSAMHPFSSSKGHRYAYTYLKLDENF